MINFRMLKLSDPAIWLSVAGLILISALAIFSSTNGIQAKLGGDIFLFLKRQAFALIFALIGMTFFA